jgi:hypothetical protein
LTPARLVATMREMRPSEKLHACPACGCHVRAAETECPHCGGRVRQADARRHVS